MFAILFCIAEVPVQWVAWKIFFLSFLKKMINKKIIIIFLRVMQKASGALLSVNTAMRCDLQCYLSGLEMRLWYTPLMWQYNFLLWLVNYSVESMVSPTFEQMLMGRFERGLFWEKTCSPAVIPTDFPLVKIAEQLCISIQMSAYCLYYFFLSVKQSHFRKLKSACFDFLDADEPLNVVSWCYN